MALVGPLSKPVRPCWRLRPGPDHTSGRQPLRRHCPDVFVSHAYLRWLAPLLRGGEMVAVLYEPCRGHARESFVAWVTLREPPHPPIPIHPGGGSPTRVACSPSLGSFPGCMPGTPSRLCCVRPCCADMAQRRRAAPCARSVPPNCGSTGATANGRVRVHGAALFVRDRSGVTRLWVGTKGNNSMRTGCPGSFGWAVVKPDK